MEKNSFACGSDDHHANSLQIPEHKDADSQLSLEEDESEDRKKKSKKTWGEIAQDAKTFMWNPNTREFMGRTARSWAYILLFYIIFYIFLAGMFSFCMYAMLLTISPYVPTYGDRVYPPGVMVKPYFSGFRFAFNASERSTWLSHVENMHRYLDAYNDSIQTSKNIECTPGKYFHQPGKEDEPKKACQFKRSLLQNCSGIEDPTFGYSLGQPCLFLKMNRIVGYEAGEGTPIYVTCEAPKGEEGDLNSVSLYPENGTFALMYYPFYGKLTHIFLWLFPWISALLCCGCGFLDGFPIFVDFSPVLLDYCWIFINWISLITPTRMWISCRIPSFCAFWFRNCYGYFCRFSWIFFGLFYVFFTWIIGCFGFPCM